MNGGNVPVNQGGNGNVTNNVVMNSNPSVVPNVGQPVVQNTQQPVPVVNGAVTSANSAVPQTSVVNPVMTQASTMNPTVSQTPVANPVMPQTSVVSPGVANVQPTFPSNPVSINNGVVPPQNPVGGEKKEVEYHAPSKFKIFFMLFFFVVIVGFVLYLPDIATMINKYRSGVNDTPIEIITTGKLKCSKETDTEEFTISYSTSFKFTDSQLKTMEYGIVTRGDASRDSEKLKEKEAQCKQLAQNVDGLSGIFVRCNGYGDHLEETQSFDLANLNVELFRAAFVEAGLMYPEYQYNQNIDEVERSMTAAGYDCSRE